jgi:hypothetical protein
VAKELLTGMDKKKDEGGRMKDEGKAVKSSLHPSSFSSILSILVNFSVS